MISLYIQSVKILIKFQIIERISLLSPAVANDTQYIYLTAVTRSRQDTQYIYLTAVTRSRQCIFLSFSGRPRHSTHIKTLVLKIILT
jgi:hypothetical protein